MRGQRCGDIELAAYLADAAGPVNLVLIAHDVGGLALTLCLTGTYPFPADIDTEPLHDAVAEKIREYRADYDNCPSHSISYMPAFATTSGRLDCELECILILQAHREPLFCSFRS